jgi:sterol 3beta-glucosyltransferase
MKIAIFSYGSRGDFEPFLALAVGLQKAGHTVILAAPTRFADFAAQHQVPFAALAGDPEEVSKMINDAGGNVFGVVKSIRDFVFSVSAEVSRASFVAAEGADLLVHSFLFTTGMHSWAREHGLPDVSIQTFPVFASTRAFPNAAFAQVPPGPLSALTHWLTEQIMWFGGNSGYKPAQAAHPEISYPSRLYWPFRETRERRRTPLLFAYSPSVLPRPVEWGADVHVPGYFFLDDDSYQPPEALTRFLQTGPPPICVTFGSMINRDAKKNHQIVTESMRSSHNRAIFMTGWGEWKTDQAPENILYLESVPFSWLLPRCKAVIHHGGAGTTAAGLRAGIPNIVIPHTADQPFWGKRVHALGAGPVPISIKKLSRSRLGQALNEIENPGLIKAAQSVGQLIRAERGLETAIGLIEQEKEWFTLKNPNL